MGGGDSRSVEAHRRGRGCGCKRPAAVVDVKAHAEEVNHRGAVRGDSREGQRHGGGQEAFAE
eukprot:11162717-Lingulodinium_polyedra.AAC.1